MAYAIDLFSGAGGMSEGILQAGFHILFSSDINESVELTYVNRHNQLGYLQGVHTFFRRADIRELTGDYIRDRINNLEIFRNGNLEVPQDIDVIFGGPPCQGFSLAGRRNAEDPRNMLFREYLRVISEIMPKYVVMENVVGFMTTSFPNFEGLRGQVYANELAPNILRYELELLGYNVLESRILNAADYGVPQARRRAIFIAYRNDVIEPSYPEPLERNFTSLLNAVGDMIIDLDTRRNLNLDDRYQQESRHGRTPNIEGNTIDSNGVLYNNELSRHMPIIVERFSLYQEGETTAMLRDRIRQEGIDITNKPSIIALLIDRTGRTEREIIDIFRNGLATNEMIDWILTKKNMRRKLSSTSVAPTVVSLPDDFISPFENRVFSVREMARLQSFDDSFMFLGPRTTGGGRRRVEVPQYTQVGNAVPPLLARAIAMKIMEALNQNNQERE